MASSLALSPSDLRRRERLRRSKTGALAFLLGAAVVFVAVQPAVRAGAGWAGWVSAAAEAGMVGGLADWFAVTALFRRPLGLPIPHTALIPARKDALGASLATFVGENFLSAAVVRRRIHDIDLADKVGAWLVVAANARRVTDEAAAVAHGALEVLSDEDVRAVVESLARRRLSALEVAPVLGRLLEEVVAGGSHRPLVDVTVERTIRWLRSHESEVVAAVQSQAPTWSPAFVDRALARRVHAEVLRVCERVAADAEHPLRRSLDRYLLGLAADLREDPSTAVRLQDLATRLFDHGATRDAVGSLVGAVRRALLALVDEPDGVLRTRVTAAVVGLGERLISDEALRTKVDGWVGDAAEHVVTRYRDEITRTITDTVERWDGDEAARRIELAAGPDLQFIRINGTVVGALAGVALHAVTVLAF